MQLNELFFKKSQIASDSWEKTISSFNKAGIIAFVLNALQNYYITDSLEWILPQALQSWKMLHVFFSLCFLCCYKLYEPFYWDTVESSTIILSPEWTLFCCLYGNFLFSIGNWIDFIIQVYNFRSQYKQEKNAASISTSWSNYSWL